VKTQEQYRTLAVSLLVLGVALLGTALAAAVGLVRDYQSSRGGAR
jgi:hypothetical protein